MLTIMTTSRKLVPQRGCSVEYLLRVFDVQIFASFEVIYRLVFGAVILEHALHVLHPGDEVEKRDKHQDPKYSVDAVEEDRAFETGPGLNEAG